MANAARVQVERIAIATGNKGKLAEFNALLKTLRIEMFQGEKITDWPPEDGIDYDSNAIIKARHGAKKWGVWCIGEDSGIEVAGLNNLPGPFSARFGQFSDAQILQGAQKLTLYGVEPANAKDGNSSDADNNARLLRLLNGKTGDARRARYVASIAVANPQGEILFSTGPMSVSGRILEAPRGKTGFGYDPIMEFYDHPGRSVAELSTEEKNAVSHRGKALISLMTWLGSLNK